MSEHSNTFKTITTEEVNDFIKEKNITILDIRDEESFSESHIPSAIRLSGNNTVSYTHLTLPTNREV